MLSIDSGLLALVVILAFCAFVLWLACKYGLGGGDER